MSRALVDDADAALAAAQELLSLPASRLRHRTADSGWSAAQHLEHLALAAQRSLGAVRTIVAGGGEARKGRGEVMARRILRTGAIPAGAQAPDPTVPTSDGDLDRAAAGLDQCRAWLRELDVSGAGSRSIPHPFLGAFTADDWLRFVAVHTHHHTGIIEAILASAHA